MSSSSSLQSSQSQSQQSQDPNPILPPYFPLKLTKCKDVSETFFECFEKESAPNGMPDVGRKAYYACEQSLIAYKACMEKNLKTHPTKW